jgi:hypothetical protein
MLDNTPAPTSAEKAFEMRFPQNSSAFLVVNSLLVYHFDRINSAPGRNVASTNPKKNLITTIPANPVTTPDSVDTKPQISIEAAMYSDGRDTRLMAMLDGTCMRMYPTYRMLRQVAYWLYERLRSDCRPLSRAAAMLLRSR